MENRQIEEITKAVETETGCDIGMDVAREEASWCSLLNVISLCLGSGMGRGFDEAGASELLKWSDMMWDDFPLRNPMPLQAIFKSGDPHLMKAFDQRDLNTWRWPSDNFDQTLVPQAQGWAILAETECAKWFERPLKSGGIPDDMAKDWTAYGMMLWSLARKQCDFAFGNMRKSKGLFCTAVNPSDMSFIEQNTDLADQACMLWACSALAALAAQSDSMYANSASRQCFMRYADDLFQAIVDNKDDLLQGSSNQTLAQSTAISALIWYTSTAEARDLRARCFWLIREFADNLVKAQNQNEMVGTTLVDAAAALRALVDAFRVTRLRTYAETASTIFNFIESQWYVRDGLYPPTPLATEYTYNADDIGIILGALNASRLFLGDRIDRQIADLRLRVFFCKAVNTSGLQMSMPSPSFMPQWLQDREPDNHFRYPATPLPSEADGQFGVAPVMAAEVGYDPQKMVWSRRTTFDTPAAMHACCEFLWINCDAVNGFPEVHLEQMPEAMQVSGSAVESDAEYAPAQHAAEENATRYSAQPANPRDSQYAVDGWVEG